MKKTQVKYNYFTILGEKVVGGATATGNSVVYAIPDIPGDEKHNQARALIKAIEGDKDLRSVIANYPIDSGTPEWEQFIQKLLNNPTAAAIVEPNIEMFRRYRISRSTDESDEPGMEVYDNDYKAQPQKKSFPSFQAHWQRGGQHRSGGGPNPTSYGPPPRRV